MMSLLIFNIRGDLRYLRIGITERTKSLLPRKLSYSPAFLIHKARRINFNIFHQTRQRIDALVWSASELQTGKRITIRGFPKHHKVKVFRVASDRRTDYVVTNDLSQSDTSVAQTACAWRWKIEQFHRETKQLTGLEKCQCRLPRIVRNHIACAFLVWVRLMRQAYETGQTLYQVKHGMFSEYLRQQLKTPSIKMDFA